MKKFFVLTTVLFSTLLFAQENIVSNPSPELIKEVREHVVKMNESKTFLLSSLKEANLVGALSEMKNYADLMGVQELTPVFSDFIASSVIEAKTCSEAFVAMSIVLFEKAPLFIDAKIVVEQDGREFEMSFLSDKENIIDAIASGYLNTMKTLCSVTDYEANLVKLNEARVEHLFNDLSSQNSCSMHYDFFKNNDIERFVGADMNKK